MSKTKVGFHSRGEVRERMNASEKLLKLLDPKKQKNAGKFLASIKFKEVKANFVFKPTFFYFLPAGFMQQIKNFQKILKEGFKDVKEGLPHFYRLSHLVTSLYIIMWHTYIPHHAQTTLTNYHSTMLVMPVMSMMHRQYP